jgi:hypothetical protein
MQGISTHRAGQSARLITALSLAMLAAGCTKQPALGAPSSDQTAFAEEYPSRLEEARTRFVNGEQNARKAFPEIRALPGKLRGGDPAVAAEVVKQADAAGRSSYYVDEALNQEATARFFAEERAGIRGRIAATVATSAKEQECVKEKADELGGTAAAAAERAVQRELEERLHDRGEATRYIEAQREALGDRNVAVLEKRADAITWTSYLTYVRLDLYRSEVDELVAQESNVKATLERSEREGKAAVDSGKLPSARRAAVEQRVAAHAKARAAIDKELPIAKQELEAMDEKLEALKRDYEAMLQAVIGELEQKAAAPGAAGKAASAAPAVDAEGDRNADITGEGR